MSIRKEQCNKVCRILDDVLANRTTERDSLIIAVRKAFESLEQLGNSERLPSAQPERKKGKWVQTIKHHKDDEQEYDYIEENCSACGCRRKIGWRGTNFCPMCGADMRGEQDE